MKPDIGDIVEIVKGHSLKEFFQSNCVIDDKIPLFTKTRYLIKTIDDKENMTWVFESKIDMISEIRGEKLKQLGI